MPIWRRECISVAVVLLDALFTVLLTGLLAGVGEAGRR
jgi:hypothetical protein